MSFVVGYKQLHFSKRLRFTYNSHQKYFSQQNNHQMLSDSEHSSDRDEKEDDYQLTINQHFARAYEYRKEREELQKRAH